MKKIIYVGLISLIMLFSSVLVYSAEPVISASSNDKTLSDTGVNKIVKGKNIKLHVYHKETISKIFYAFDDDEEEVITKTTDKTTESIAIIIPNKYQDGELHHFFVYAEADNGEFNSEWIDYSFKVIVTEETVLVPTIKIDVDGKNLSTSKINKASADSKINLNISASTGVDKVIYGFEDEDSKSKSTGKFSISIPEEYKDGSTFYLYIQVVDEEGAKSVWYDYAFKVIKAPTLELKINGKKVKEKNLTQLNEGDKINVIVNNGVKLDNIIYAYVGSSKEYEIDVKTGKIDILDKYKNGQEFDIEIIAQSTDGIFSKWYEYSFVYLNEEELEVPIITVKNNNNSLKTNQTNTVKLNDIITIKASCDDGIKNIIYEIDNENKMVSSKTVELKIDERYNDGKKHKLTIKAISEKGKETELYSYFIKIEEEQLEPPIIIAKLNGSTIKVNKTNIVQLDDIITIKASCDDGIKKIIYEIDNNESKTIESNETEIEIVKKYNDGEKHSIIVKAESKKGQVSDVYTYYFELDTYEDENDEPSDKPNKPNKPNKPGINKEDENVKDNILIENDEIINNVSNLAVSLRNEGTNNDKKNRFALSELVYYNIDYINGETKITNNVLLTFEIPENVGVEFYDTNGGKVNGRKISWTLKGLNSGENGTIQVSLKYKNLSDNYIIVNPISVISYNNMKDSSAVKNLVYQSNKVLDLNHKPYMFGDASDTSISKFRPNDGLNRAEMAAVITRVFELDKVQNGVLKYTDNDVIAHDLYRWSTQDIYAVTNSGIMQGYEDGTFRPGNKVTKGEFITILARIIENKNGEGFDIKNEPIKIFAHNKHWASIYVAQLGRLNMLKELINKDSNLDEVITRAEVTHLINQILLRGPASGNSNVKFSDVNINTPYFADILEATSDNHDVIYNTSDVETIY